MGNLQLVRRPMKEVVQVAGIGAFVLCGSLVTITITITIAVASKELPNDFTPPRATAAAVILRPGAQRFVLHSFGRSLRTQRVKEGVMRSRHWRDSGSGQEETQKVDSQTKREGWHVPPLRPAAKPPRTDCRVANARCCGIECACGPNNAWNQD